ncbi:hypothetical protein HFP43_16440 [Streptomyces sp. SJ1-7]|nr:hypothetical protein [Streptomyces sp. SJ1-7]
MSSSSSTGVAGRGVLSSTISSHSARSAADTRMRRPALHPASEIPAQHLGEEGPSGRDEELDPADL